MASYPSPALAVPWPDAGPTSTDHADNNGPGAAPAWRRDAACEHVPTDLFFPVGHGPAADAQVEVAKSICAACPVKVPCLEYALATNVQYGVFGGLTEDERREVRRQVARRHELPLSQLARLGNLSRLVDLAGLAGVGPYQGLVDEGLEESA